MNCCSVMLRNHLVVDYECVKIPAIFIGLYYLFTLFLELLIYILLFHVHIRARKSIHPFFSTLFGLIIASYIACVLLEMLCQFAFITYQNEKFLDFSFISTGVAYSVTTPICLCCAIERTIATVWAVSYENYKNWPLFILMLTLVLALFFLIRLTFDEEMVWNTLITIVTIFCCCVLYVMNYRMTIRCTTDIVFMSNITLSTRYQIIENMMVVRQALLPVLVFDSIVTFTDHLSLWTVDSRPNALNGKKLLLDCNSFMAFIPYFSLGHVAALFEFLIPLYVLFRWKAYQNKLPTIFKCCFPIRSIQQSGQTIIKNTLGRDLNIVPNQRDYFTSLKNHWK